jgi:chromosomal replication initiator protein
LDVKNDDTEIVSAVRKALAERIGKDRYTVWFGSCVRLDLDGQTLRVAAGDRFTLDRVRTRFRQEIDDVCRGVLGTSLRIRFCIDPSLQSHATQRGNHSEDQAKPERTTASSRKSSYRSSRRRLARLDEFVVGPCNRVGFTAAQSILDRLGQVSPLFLYGTTGTGKTHLLEGVASAARQRRGVKRVVLLSSEQFTAYFVHALQGSGLPSFRRKYRDVDVLLIDDLQFFDGKTATIIELKHTIDRLLGDGRQVVLSADRSLSEISGLGSDLIARISGGLICGLELPDEATRLQLARRMAAVRGVQVSEDILRLIAQRVFGDARQIAGALNRLRAVAEAAEQPVTTDMAGTALSDIFRTSQRVIRLPDIENAVCGLFGVDARGLHSHRKSKTLAQPRMLAMWLARKYTRAAFSEIGEHFGHRSHSTVISANKKVESWLADDAKIQLGHADCGVRDVIRRVEARLRAG